MKLATLATLVSATSVGIAEAAPLNQLDLLRIATLGGSTFRIKAVPNKAFYYGAKRGPIALARAYSKFGQQMPPDLLLVVETILKELGLILKSPKHGVGVGKGGSSNGTVGNDDDGNVANAPQGGIYMRLNPSKLTQKGLLWTKRI
jgi:hypothetical protein